MVKEGDLNVVGEVGGLAKKRRKSYQSHRICFKFTFQVCKNQMCSNYSTTSHVLMTLMSMRLKACMEKNGWHTTGNELLLVCAEFSRVCTEGFLVVISLFKHL